MKKIAALGATALLVTGVSLGLAFPASAEEAPVDPAATEVVDTETTAPVEEPIVEEPVVPAEEPAPVAEPDPEPVTETPTTPVEQETEVPVEEEPVAFVPYTAYDSWTLPSSWSDPLVEPSYSSAIYDQTLGATCGVWNQNDAYLIDSPEKEALHAAIVADGILTMGEDSAIYLSHTYTFNECVGPNPPNPAGSISQDCGFVSINLTNFRTDDEVENLTASFVIYVDGEFYGAPALVSGQNYVEEISFGEDTGNHTVEVRTGPAFGDQQIDFVTVESDCIVPEVPVEPETPVVVVPPAPEPVTPVTTVEPVVDSTPVADDTLAETGFDSGIGPWLALSLLAGGLIASSIALLRREKLQQTK